MLTEEAILSERFQVVDLFGHYLVLLQPLPPSLLVLLHFVRGLHVNEGGGAGVRPHPRGLPGDKLPWDLVQLKILALLPRDVPI